MDRVMFWHRGVSRKFISLLFYNIFSALLLPQIIRVYLFMISISDIQIINENMF